MGTVTSRLQGAWQQLQTQEGKAWSHAFDVLWGRKDSKAAHYWVAKSYTLKSYFLQGMKNPLFQCFPVETLIPNTGAYRSFLSVRAFLCGVTGQGPPHTL